MCKREEWREENQTTPVRRRENQNLPAEVKQLRKTRPPLTPEVRREQPTNREPRHRGTNG